ncbi:hypothetical protein PCG10_000943 [Penicillium crustosum]|uniref:Uncharacterized protein n=1 Tax=Penicillium crustosum TaxID=36656 RepID=A0A9P5GNJ0_PENCR|nr:uncharacterized protein N7487_012121 [Penicillium crustosum]KAF7528335.1 hypothetical protein PCG10_000943 [Penicillium crustosum]KAJ5394480.1 hypothetical protein N7487_012121 [Penicillium crustosum]
MRIAIIASALALVAGANAALSPREAEPTADLSEKLQESYDLIVQIASIVFPEKTPSKDQFLTQFLNRSCQDGISAVIEKQKEPAYEYNEFTKESICKCWGTYIKGYREFLDTLIQYQDVPDLAPFKPTIAKLTLELKEAFDDSSVILLDRTPFCADFTNSKQEAPDKEFEQAVGIYGRS